MTLIALNIDGVGHWEQIVDQKETTALNGVAGQIVAQVVHEGDTACHVFESIGFLGPRKLLSHLRSISMR